MTVLQRPCIACGNLIASGSYCGGCRPNYAPTRLRGRKWQRKRWAVLRRNEGVCERCQSRLAVEIHHLGAVDDNRPEMLLALCRNCHLQAEREKHEHPAR